MYSFLYTLQVRLVYTILLLFSNKEGWYSVSFIDVSELDVDNRHQMMKIDMQRGLLKINEFGMKPHYP